MKKREAERFIDFRAFVESSDIIFWQVDAFGRIEYVSPSIKKILGYDAEDFVGKMMPPHVAGDELVRQYNISRKLLCDLSPKSFELIRTRQHKDGRLFRFLIKGEPFYDQKGRFMGYRGESRLLDQNRSCNDFGIENIITRDIFFKTIFDTLPIRIFWKDRNGYYQGANTLFLQDNFLKTGNQLLGKRDDEIFTPERADIYSDGDYQILHRGWQFFTSEHTLHQEDTKQMHIILYKTPLRNEKREIVGVIGSYVDITKEKIKENFLIESFERLKQAQELAQLGYWDYDPLKRDWYWSEGTYKLFGYKYDRPRITIEKFLSHVHPDDRWMIKKKFEKIFENKEGSFNIIHRIIRVDGEEAILHSIAQTVFDRYQSIWLRGISIDITHIEQLQREKRKQDFLLLQQSRLSQMGQLLDNIVHQWKQPLTELNALLLNLENDFFNHQLNKAVFEQYFENFEEITSFLGQTIDNFRESMAVPDEIESFNPKIAFKKALKLLEKRISQTNIDVIENLQSPKAVLGTQQDLIHIFLVLLNNAIDALEAKRTIDPKILVSGRANRDQYTILFEDNAGGITDEIANRIFDPYFSTKSNGKGRGIGLFIAKMISENRLFGKLQLVQKESARFQIDLRIRDGNSS